MSKQQQSKIETINWIARTALVLVDTRVLWLFVRGGKKYAQTRIGLNIFEGDSFSCGQEKLKKKSWKKSWKVMEFEKMKRVRTLLYKFWKEKMTPWTSSSWKLACITGALWAKRGERGILREALSEVKRETSGG